MTEPYLSTDQILGRVLDRVSNSLNVTSQEQALSTTINYVDGQISSIEYYRDGQKTDLVRTLTVLRDDTSGQIIGTVII